MRALLLAAGLVSASLVAPASADACSPPLPGFSGIMPPDGASVPTNFVAYVDGFDIFPYEAYWLDFDVFLPMETGRLGRLGTAQLIAEPPRVPNPLQVTFEAPPENGFPPFEPIQANYRYTFVEDRAAPVFDAAPSLDVSFQTDPGGGLCTPPGYHVRVTALPASDDFGVAAYVLREARGPNEEEPVVASRLAPADRGEVSLTAYPGEDPGPRCYRLVAYDYAGNATATPVACFDPTPGGDAGVNLDAGTVIPGSDGGPGPDAGPRLLAGDEGCTCLTASPGPPVVAAALGLAALPCRGRRRRRRG